MKWKIPPSNNNNMWKPNQQKAAIPNGSKWRRVNTCIYLMDKGLLVRPTQILHMGSHTHTLTHVHYVANLLYENITIARRHRQRLLFLLILSTEKKKSCRFMFFFFCVWGDFPSMHEYIFVSLILFGYKTQKSWTKQVNQFKRHWNNTTHVRFVIVTFHSLHIGAINFPVTFFISSHFFSLRF